MKKPIFNQERLNVLIQDFKKSLTYDLHKL